MANNYDPKYDLNKDGIVNAADFSILSKKRGPVNTSDAWSVACDFNKDGVVDEKDVDLFNAHYRTTGDPNAKAGVPTWLIITGIGVIAIMVLAKIGKS